MGSERGADYYLGDRARGILLPWSGVCQAMDVFLLAKDTCGPNGKEMSGANLGLCIIGLPGSKG